MSGRKSGSRTFAQSRVNALGLTVKNPTTSERLTEFEALIEKTEIGTYELVFHVGEYFKEITKLQNPNFLNEVPIKFSISNPKEKYHVPLLFSPWSYSTYRGS